MKIVKTCLLTGLALGLPLAAAAQHTVTKVMPTDIAYCHALARSYSSLWPVNEAMPVSDAVTLTRCDSAPQATIAELERMLKDEKIKLPPDVGIAQPPASPGDARHQQQ
jgi:hypothetical protein